MRNKLSADPAALILGILSVVLVILGCCCGIIAPVTLTLGIVGLVMAKKSLKEYELEPDIYDPKSRSNVYIGKVLSIIGIVLSSLLTLAMIIYFIFVGKLITDEDFMKEFRKDIEKNQRVHDSTESDVIEYDSTTIDADTVRSDTDTLKIDTTPENKRHV